MVFFLHIEVLWRRRAEFPRAFMLHVWIFVVSGCPSLVGPGERWGVRLPEGGWENKGVINFCR
jgi:hypothetical protein